MTHEHRWVIRARNGALGTALETPSEPTHLYWGGLDRGWLRTPDDALRYATHEAAARAAGRLPFRLTDGGPHELPDPNH